MQSADLVNRLVNLAETRGDATHIDDAVVAHIARALHDQPQQNPAAVVAEQAETVGRALMKKGVSFGILGQVWDSFRREEARCGAINASYVAPTVAPSPPAVNTRASAPMSCTSNTAPLAPLPPLRAHTTMQDAKPYAAPRPQITGMPSYGPVGLGALGMGSNSAMLQMQAMNDDMTANRCDIR